MQDRFGVWCGDAFSNTSFVPDEPACRISLGWQILYKLEKFVHPTDLYPAVSKIYNIMNRKTIRRRAIFVL